MNKFDELKNLWQRGGHNIPEVSDMMKIINDYNRKSIRKHRNDIMSLLFVIFIFIPMIYFSNLYFITTYIAVSVSILAMIWRISFNLYLTKILNHKIDLTSDSISYLNQMLRYKKSMDFIHKAGMKIYLFAFVLGFALYLVEFLVRFPAFGVIGLIGTAAILYFGWYLYYKHTVQNESSDIDLQIDRIKALIDDLSS